VAKQFDFRAKVLQLVREHNCKHIAEIGVYRGLLSKRLWSTPEIVSLLLVDPWAVSGAQRIKNGKLSIMDSRRRKGREWEQEELDEIYKGIHRAAPSFVTILRMTSMEAVKLVDDESLDMVFIDALHDYEHGMEDIAEWRKKVRSGGIIAGDDFSTRFPGMCRAVEESLPGFSREQRVWWREL